MLCGVIVLFVIIVLRLFSLQIIHGEEYDASITASISRTRRRAAASAACRRRTSSTRSAVSAQPSSPEDTLPRRVPP